jgi:hypothetical protein
LILVAVELSDGLLGVPGGGDLALRVSGFEQVEQLGSAVFAQALLGHGEKSTSPIEGVVLSASMTERLVLDSTADLIKLGRGELDHMERVGDQGDVGEFVEEDLPIGRREIQGAVRDAGAPGLRLASQPVDGSLAASCLDDVEQLAGSVVDDKR